MKGLTGNRIGFWVSQAAALLIPFLFFCGTGLAEPQQQRIRPVKTVVVKERHTMDLREFPGIARSAKEVKLSFRVAGPVISFDTTVGRSVEKGEVLARIDPRDFQNQIDRLKAGVREAQAKLSAMKKGARPADVKMLESELDAARAAYKEAKQNYERISMLYEKEVVPESYYEKARSAFDTASAKQEAAAQNLAKARKGSRAEDVRAMESKIDGLESQLKAARDAYGDTFLRAPFKGVVNRKFAEVHETVAAGHPVLTLLDFSAREVRTTIPEKMVRSMDDVNHIECTFNAIEGKTFQADIKEIGKKTDTANQSYPVTLVVHATRKSRIYPGMAATVSFSLPSDGEDRGIAVPADSIFADKDGTSCVWVVNEDSMTVEKRRIEGVTLSGKTAVLKNGVFKGDRVVCAGAPFLEEGRKVKLLNNESSRR
ncbi:MAG: efflux RND transporter periplasmic adaptor subunit [Desulfarculaceae bacterium]|nr:efflux RND transporter periplasmic adaptor subunit [Desulfarculaceae bacterium]